MIPTNGLPAAFALKLIDREREKFDASIERDPINKREIAAFKERIGTIQTAEALVNDYEVYSFVMKAFDLEDQIFGKAMVKKILQSDSSEKTSLINKMTDTRFKDMFKTLGFTEAGTKNPNTTDADWVESLVERYVERKLVNSQLNLNETVGTVLHVQSRAEDVTTWYQVLADTKLQNFFYTAFSLPDAMKGSDLDAQVATLKKRFDISTLNDPGVLDTLTKRYTALAEAQATQNNMSSNPILQLFTSGSAQSSIIQISLDGLQTLRQNRY